MRRFFPAAVIVFLASTFLLAASSDAPLLLRFPTVSKTQIVFNYAGDLWIVSREGGDAHRLTSGIGVETLPHFSPDGSMIAFTGEYDGNRDVYVVPATGGVPRRLTYHPAEEFVAGWTPDGKKDPVQLLGQQLYALRGPALHRAGRRRTSESSSPADRRGRLLLARWNAYCLRPAPKVAGGLEALSRRPDHPDLDCRSQRFQHREGSAREFQRSSSHVDRRHHLFPLRPQRSRQPVRLRHKVEAGERSSAQRRTRFQDRIRRP